MKCAIADKYLSEDCRSFTFGDNVVKSTVVFGEDVVAYQNGLGVVSYGGISSIEQDIKVGVELEERLFYDIHSVVVEKYGNFSINPNTWDLISSDMRRLLKSSNTTIKFDNNEYIVYDDDHLVKKSDIAA